jgi:hypothetical protein
MDTEIQFKAISKEIDEVRKGIERSYAAINTLFGLVLPVALSFFIFVAKDESKIETPVLAFIFIALLSMAFIWSQIQWIELLRYVRYYYVELMPRFYRVSGQANSRSMMEWIGPRRTIDWLPMLIFNIGCLGLASAAFLVTLEGTHFVAVGAALFILGASVSVTFVMGEAKRVDSEILQGANERINK